MAADKALTERQKAFAEAYVEQGLKNPRQAALKAGFKNSSGLSAQASRMLKDVKIASYIKELDERFEVTAKKERAHQEKVDAIEETYVKAINYIHDVITGTAKDQFGLDIPARDKLTACKEAIRLRERKEAIDKQAQGSQQVGGGTYVITPVYGVPQDGDGDD